MNRTPFSCPRSTTDERPGRTHKQARGGFWWTHPGPVRKLAPLFEIRTAAATSVDSVLDHFVSRAYGSADRLLDARDLLGEQDQGARALLLRASRRAGDPQPPEPPRPFTAPDAPRP